MGSPGGTFWFRKRKSERVKGGRTGQDKVEEFRTIPATPDDGETPEEKKKNKTYSLARHLGSNWASSPVGRLCDDTGIPGGILDGSTRRLSVSSSSRFRGSDGANSLDMSSPRACNCESGLSSAQVSK